MMKSVGKYCIESLLFLSVFITFSYFYNGAAWNHNSRLDTIFSFVEPGSPDHFSFRINRFITDPIRGKNTGDWARFDGNYYSNKAPGIALLGIPPYFLLFHFETWLGLDPTSDFASLVNVYFLHLLLTVLPISTAAVFFFKMLQERCDVDRSRALGYTIILFWGTLIFPYSSQLWGHVTAAAFVIIAFYFVLANAARAVFYAGFLMGLSVLSEYSCIIIVTTLVVSLLSERKFVQLIFLMLGGLLPFLAFVSYHKICFGSFLAIANFYNNPYYLSEGAVGNIFSGLNGGALWGLTFSRYRGVFIYMPILLLIFPALYFLLTRKPPALFWISLANIIGFMVMNVSFNGWHGGACVGPRYQIPVLPFYVILLLLLPDRLWIRVAHGVLLIPSLLTMFICAAISPMIPQNVADPLLTYFKGLKLLMFSQQNILQPYVLPIRLQSSDLSVVQEFSAFNWGNLMGLSDAWSLTPLLLFFSVICWWTWKNFRRNGSPTVDGTSQLIC